MNMNFPSLKVFSISICCIVSFLAAKNTSIEHVLNNKVILCTGPAYGKRQQLVTITAQDLGHISFKKIFVITNDQALMDLCFEGKQTICYFFPARGKQLDCLNCIIHSLIQVALDTECLDDDIILFKHESVFINDMNLVLKAIEKIVQGYDIVAKYWVGAEHITSYHCNDYYHTDSFFMSVRAARFLAQELREIQNFTQEYQFCEEYFTKYMVDTLSHVYKIDYHHSSWKDNELGFYHIPRYEEDPDWYWDKSNYSQLYIN